MAFVKLDTGILDSSLWVEDAATRIVFITMLAMSDAEGLCAATAPGIARRANLPLGQVRKALAELEGPDPESRTLEGRFKIALPSGASLQRFAMKIGNMWQESEVVELTAAREAY